VSSGLQSAVEHWYGLERRRSDFRVEDTARLLAALGDPHRRYRSVHVAGTNGKGSVCALVERVLRAAGVRTGLMTSPHLVDYRERFRIAGAWAPEPELAARIEAIGALPEATGRTFFEVTTALGFDTFARHGVEWAVVEVGLGGRLDATNVLAPDACAVTSIALDHTEMLGDTAAAIAREKAGIFKPGVPVVAGALDRDARAAARAVADECGAPWRDAANVVALADVRTHAGGATFTATMAPWEALPLAIGLRGAHQVANARTALALLATLAAGGLDVPAAAVRDGLAATRWPGRLEPCPDEPRLWWDGAHNSDGLARLVTAWTADLALPPPAAIVFAVSRDKPARAMLEALRAFAPAAAVHVARTRNDRALVPDALLADAHAAGLAATAHDSVVAACEAALAATDGRVLLAGSLFAVGEAMERFGGAPGEIE